MNTKGVQFKKFKQQFQCKNTKVKLNADKVIDPIYHVPKIQNTHRSPQKQPTSFRQLSGSREKNKLFSGKKAALENKLNTLRSNEKNKVFQISSDEKSKPQQFDSAKKQGLFSKLLTSRSPHSIKKNGVFDDSTSSTNTANDSSGISFSAFKGINLGQNQNCSTLNLQKKSSTEEQNQEKGLKFRGFPHKRPSTNNIGAKTKVPAAPIIMLAQGPLISEKGRSRSKSHKKEPIGLKQQKSPLTPVLTKQASQPQPQMAQYRRTSTFQKQSLNEYGLECRMSNNFGPERDEVIRSREGSVVFDMSPTLC